MKFKVFKIRLEKKYFRIDQKKVNKFKEKVNVKKNDTNTIIENGKPILIVTYHYIDKVEIQYDLNEEQQILFETLKEWRKGVYQKERIKAYEVMIDRVMCSIVKMRPTTSKELLQVVGIGNKKVDKYGGDIISIINSYN